VILYVKASVQSSSAGARRMDRAQSYEVSAEAQ
jgi:hypothetical protein